MLEVCGAEGRPSLICPRQFVTVSDTGNTSGLAPRPTATLLCLLRPYGLHTLFPQTVAQRQKNVHAHVFPT